LNPASGLVDVPMPEGLGIEKGNLFLAMAVMYRRADGSLIGEDRWKGLWVV
jgi:hypothetical protein